MFLYIDARRTTACVYWGALGGASLALLLGAGVAQVGDPILNGPLAHVCSFIVAPTFTTGAIVRWGWFREHFGLTLVAIPFLYAASLIAAINLGMLFWLRP